MERPLDVAVVGVGCLFPKAQGRSAYWANILGGVDAIREVPSTHWNAADYLNPDPKKPDHVYSARGGFLDPVDFDALEFGVSPNNLEATDASQLLALVAVQQALDDAGYGAGGRSFDRKRTSVLLGVTGTLQLVIPLGARLGHPIWRKALHDAGVDPDMAEDVVARIGDAYVPWQENSFPGLLGNVVAGRIANRFDFGGSNCVVDAACASSLAAIHLAAMELQSGRADMVVTGGADAFNDIFMYMCFSKTPALSPTGDAKPFDQSGDGTILGEGLGVLLMKRLADAERDGDRVYAVLKGIGTSSDGRGNAIYAPTAKGQRDCLRSAYAAAGVSPDTIELVEAHGTGTRVGDGVEVSALTEVYSQTGRRRPWCAVGSVKSQIGHTKAAAGAAGLIKATLALHQKVLPPTIKVTKPVDPLTDETSPFYVNTLPRPWTSSPDHPRRAAVSAFGFGGSNFHAVLEEHTAAKTDVDWDADVQIVPFAADSLADLRGQVDAWIDAVDSSDWQTLRVRAADLRGTFRADRAFRLIGVLERAQRSEQTLAEMRRLAAAAGDRFVESPQGVFGGAGAPAGDLAFLFPGQGSQYVGMLRDLACRFPEMLAALETAEREVLNLEPEAARLSDILYPPPAFSEAKKADQEERLRATEWAQPALGAASAGLFAVLKRFGLRPGAIAGHSYGELVALHAAGCFDGPTLHRLSRSRGAAMAGAGRGEMLAVSAPIDDVERFLTESKLPLVIANRNAPKQVVLSGTTDAIEQAAKVLSERNLRTHRLNVSAAFHSPLVADAAVNFAAALAAAPFAAPATPIYANTTARPYGDDVPSSRELLAAQLARPVEFDELIRNMHADGVRTFVEVGPSNKLTGLVRSILENAPHETAALDGSSGRRSGMGDLARILAKIVALGHVVDLAPWDPAPPAPASSKTRSTVSLTGANYKAQRPQRPPREKPSVPTPPTGTHDAPMKTAAVHPADPSTPSVTPPVPSTSVSTMPPLAPTPQLPISNELLREGIFALQRAQQQTADLHRQFLESQHAAQQTLLALLGGPSPTPASAHVTPVPPAFVAAPPTVASMSSATTPPGAAPTPEPTPPVSEPTAAQRRGAPPADIGVLLLEIVAEKTGYPTEMLTLEMGLDADLGIDSIKRVEILSALQEKLPSTPRIAAEQLGALRTLQDVVNVLGERMEDVPLSAAPTGGQKVDAGAAAVILLEVVAEKTGYPVEMLNLEMGLDADLGIDSIKRVEILSAVKDRLPNAQTIAADQIGVLRTLADVAAALAPDGATAAAPAVLDPSPARMDLAPAGDGELGDLLLKIVADKTGYPVEMLSLEMGLDADLGIDSIKRVEILSSLQEAAPALPRFSAEQLGALRTLGDIVAAFAAPSAASSANGKPSTNGKTPGLATHSTSDVATGPEVPSTLDLYAPKCVPLPSNNRPRLNLETQSLLWIVGAPTERRASLAAAFCNRNLNAVALTCREALAAADPNAVHGLVFVPTDDAALDGADEALAVLKRSAEGLTRQATSGAMLGALLGFGGRFGLDGKASTLHEPRQASVAGLVKTARFEWPNVACKVIDADPFADLDDVADEFLTNGPIEVGISATERVRIALEPFAVDLSTDGAPIARGELILVAGGGRGVTAATAIALAKAFRPTIALLGRSTLSDEPAWLGNAATEAEIKRLLLSHADDRPTPKQLGERCAAVLAQREVRRTLAAIDAVGGIGVYRTLDVRDRAQVERVADELRAEFGPVRGLVHGAGVLADRLIVDKTPDDYRAVFGAKVDGAENLLAGLADDDLRLLVFFSSSTARFGRKGQCDYAAANETLNKLAQREQHRRPDCRVLSPNWGPWDGGMVDARLKSLFADEGVAVIPQAAGAELLVKLARIPTSPVEVVVLGPGSHIPNDALAAGPEAPRADPSYERVVDLASHPVLRSHVIKGKAVLPAALMIEWSAHAALLRNPGLAFAGAEDFRVLAGVKLGEDDRISLAFVAGKGKRDGDLFRVPVELRSDRGGKTVLHARGTIMLAERAGPAVDLPTIAAAAGESYDIETVYEEFLFHGPALHAFASTIAIGETGAVAELLAAPSPADWFERPVRSRWLSAPLALDAAFQLAVIWTRVNHDCGCLPTRVGAYRQFAGAFDGPAHLRGRFSRSAEAVCRGDFEFVGTHGNVVARLSACEFVVDPSLNVAFRVRECGAGS